MPDERDISGWFEVVDETNVPNPWQSAIRYGLLDLDLLAETIAADVVKADGVELGLSVAVSCLDQAEGDVPHLAGGILAFVPPAGFAAEVAEAVGASRSIGLWAPGRVEDPLGIAA